MTFKYGDLRVEIFYNGSDKLPNKTYIGDVLVCEDATFRPSPMYNIDSYEVMASLLFFLTIPRGAVEDEFFEQRNSPYLDRWAESEEGKEVRRMSDDYEMLYDDQYVEEYGEGELRRLERYTTIH